TRPGYCAAAAPSRFAAAAAPSRLAAAAAPALLAAAAAPSRLPAAAAPARLAAAPATTSTSVLSSHPPRPLPLPTPVYAHSRDRHLDLRVLIEPGQAHLQADTGLLVPAERGIGRIPDAAVDVDRADPQPRRDARRPVRIGREPRAAQPVRRVVGNAYRVVVA